MKFIVLAFITLLVIKPAWAQSEYGTHEIQLDESNVQIEAKDYYYNFGYVRIGQHASTRFTLSNNGRFPIYIDSIKINGPSFSSNNNCPRFLLKGHSCRIRVGFAPYAIGQYSGDLKINLTGSQDVIVHLRGRGVSRF